jgi:hypothetical protein
MIRIISKIKDGARDTGLRSGFFQWSGDNSLALGWGCAAKMRG